METSITLNRIFINILLGVATAVGTTVIPYLIVVGRKWLLSKLSKEKSDAAIIAYNYVSGITYDVVKAAQETFVKEVKEAAKDGKITQEERLHIKQKVATEVKAMLSVDVVNAIGKDGANVDALISNLIESRLKDIKCEGEVATK